jgi:uncharacterized membrane protein YqjE
VIVVDSQTKLAIVCTVMFVIGVVFGVWLAGS